LDLYFKTKKLTGQEGLLCACLNITYIQAGLVIERPMKNISVCFISNTQTASKKITTLLQNISAEIRLFLLKKQFIR
jgi:hypothetical protein